MVEFRVLSVGNPMLSTLNHLDQRPIHPKRPEIPNGILVLAHVVHEYIRVYLSDSGDGLHNRGCSGFD